jgi:hypothetical protein
VAQTRGRVWTVPRLRTLIHKELRRRAVTLKLLWDEYREATQAGRSQYSELYRRWARRRVCLGRPIRPASGRSWTTPHDHAGE